MASWSLSYWTFREVPDPVRFHWWDRDSSRALQSLWQPLHLRQPSPDLVCGSYDQKWWFQGQVTFHEAPSQCVGPGDFVLGAGFSQALMFSKLNQVFFFFLIIYLFILAVLGLHCFEGSSQAEVSGGYSSLRCLDFLLQWLLLLQSTGYRARRLHSPGSSGVSVPPPECRLGSCGAGSAALQHVGSSRTRNRTCVSCIGRRTLHHWATREVPSCAFINLFCCLGRCGSRKNKGEEENNKSSCAWADGVRSLSSMLGPVGCLCLDNEDV